MNGATVSEVQVTAAHDGVAELKLTLRHANGGLSPITLDETAVRALMEACGATEPDALVGVGWEKIRDALTHSWNRLNPLP